MGAAQSQTEQSWDEVQRAMDRAGAHRHSELATEVRQNLFYITGTDMLNRDAKIDRFIAEQRGNPIFADSFITPPREKERPHPLNLLRLTPELFADVASGKLKVE